MDVLAPLAERLIAALEQPSEAPIKPRPVLHDLEAELLAGRQPQVQTSTTAGRGGEQPSAGRVSVASSKAVEESSSELELLRADCEQLLHQREKMRAQLIAEQDRRERAEADLVALGAQWLGTETQQALAERADAERRRALDVERESLRREAEQRISVVQAESALLREKLGDKAPTKMQLRLQLRAALQAELEQERKEARESVASQLASVTAERDQLASTLRRAEVTHREELEALRLSVRRASEMLQEQYDRGFVHGLKKAALALWPENARARGKGDSKPGCDHSGKDGGKDDDLEDACTDDAKDACKDDGKNACGESEAGREGKVYHQGEYNGAGDEAERADVHVATDGEHNGEENSEGVSAVLATTCE